MWSSGRLLVEDPRLDGAEVRVGPHVPPQVGVVLDRPAPHHLLDPVRVDLPGPVVGRDADPREGPEDRRPRRHHPRPLPAPEGRVRGQREQQRQVAPDRVRDVDRPVGVVDRHVDVGAEDQLLVGDVAKLLGELPVAGAIDDLLVLPERERVGARGRQQEPPPLGDLGDLPAEPGRARRRPRRRSGTAWWRSRAPTASARASPGPRAPRAPPRASPRPPEPGPGCRRRRSSAPPRRRS